MYKLYKHEHMTFPNFICQVTLYGYWDYKSACTCICDPVGYIHVKIGVVPAEVNGL